MIYVDEESADAEPTDAEHAPQANAPRKLVPRRAKGPHHTVRASKIAWLYASPSLASLVTSRRMPGPIVVETVAFLM